MRPLLIVGPTAAGKTDIALSLAERHGAIVVSMDAMQVYRGMDIGTAKVSPEIRARIPHRCVDLRDPDEAFSVADFLVEAEAAMGEGRPVILCGGTTFYLRAFLDGLVPAPPADLALRAELQALVDPWPALDAVDPILAARLHPNDHLRIVRGLEVFRLTGIPLSAHHAGHVRERRAAEVIWVDRDDLEARIVDRLHQMMDQGYLDEVRGLLARGYVRSLKPMQSLGYEHLAAHLEGELSAEEAVRCTLRDSRHFARKQRGFLRGQGFSPVYGDRGGEAALAGAAAAERAFGAQ